MNMTMTPHTPAPPPLAAQWQQVLDRDASADGRFVYAVRSTGIFCRPSCPSRKPSRENVAFFSSAEEARAAGFRPCMRCKPEQVGQADPQAAAVARVAAYLKEHADEPLTTERIARATGVDRHTILRGFRQVLGVTPGQYARAERMAGFRRSLGEPAKRVTDAIYEAGYGSASRLYETSNAALGMTPRQLRAGGEGQMIRYSTADSPLGRMLVAATETGVCSIAFGETDEELIAGLRERFPRAEPTQAPPTEGWLAEAVAFVASQTTEHPLAATFPLDVRATAFQQRVWRALREIPRGETRSYSELAASLGSPAATRAVASACGANPVAVLVPCHRVVGKDGSLTGYRWGLERKRRLLEAERG